MQTMNTYIRTSLAVCRLLLLSLCLSFLASCLQEEDGMKEDGMCDVTVSLSVAPYEAAGNTKTRAYVNGNHDENLVNGFWIFQYNADTGQIIGEPGYRLAGNDLNNLDIKFTQNAAGEKSVICFIANTGDDKWITDANKAEFDTYEKLRQHIMADAATKAFDSQHLGPIGGTGPNGETGLRSIPMCGVSKPTVIASKTYVSIPLVRMFARMTIDINGSYISDENIKIKNLTLRNIPSYCRVSTLEQQDLSQPAIYPNITWTDYDAKEAGKITIYMPENLQGKVPGMTAKKDAKAELFPANAFKVDLTMNVNGTEKKYTLYPGLDMVNDFNIRRNHIYNVNIKINKTTTE